MCATPQTAIPTVIQPKDEWSEKGIEYPNEQRIECPTCGALLRKAFVYVNDSHDGTHDNYCPLCFQDFWSIRTTKETVNIFGDESRS